MFWLENTDHTITDIWLDAGFESQRTFNRVFREKYKVTPHLGIIENGMQSRMRREK